MIFDCFPFFNELEVLNIRLELLYDHVDYFILSECDYTFSGLKKPFYFEENKEKYSKYLDKIIHVKNTNTDKIDNLHNDYSGKKRIIYQNIIDRLEKMKKTSETDFGKPHWCRDYLHKELTMLGMDICNPNDIIFFGDLDEIPNPESIKIDGGSYLLNQSNMQYYLNKRNITQPWHGTYITKFENILENSCMFTREKRFSFEIIKNAGWHLTFMGGESKVSEKINSYGHQEYNIKPVHDQIPYRMSKNLDILGRNIEIVDVNFESTYPEKIVQLIKEKYPYMIKNQ